MKFFLLVIYLLLFPSLMIADIPSCDYVKNGYYQLIYEADIDYLTGNKEEAYRKIVKAEKICSLLEQPMYYEMSRYVELLCERSKFDEALHYITILVKDYGYSSESFEKKDYFQKMGSHLNWDTIKVKLDNLNKLFHTKVNVQLVKELENMCNNDQKVRKEWQESQTTENQQKIQKTDSIHEKRIKEIFEQYGYPNEQMIGQKNTMITHRISTMLMHLEDTAYFKPVLLQFIKKGECAPTVLGNFVDSRMRLESRTDKYIYRIYRNVADNEIWDITNLNNRRQSIGMPTVEMQHKRDSVIRIILNE